MARAATRSVTAKRPATAAKAAASKPAAARMASASTAALPAHAAVDIASNAKRAMIDLCNARLAEAIDLALITKQAHWNIKGPTFIAVHLLLDDLRTELDEHVDIIAERVAQLDGIALGTVQATAENTSLAAYPTDIRQIADHLKALVTRYGQTADNARKAIDTADEAGDVDTSDIFTAYSRALDKSLWFLKSHLQ